MTKVQTNSTCSKSKGLVFFEYAALAICLCIIALRTTFTESPDGLSADQPIGLSNSVYSLSISTLLISLPVLWFMAALCSRKFSYRFTGIEIGLGLLVIASVVSGFAAPEKRAAITDAVCLLAPPLFAILLVQILDRQSKIRLVLVVIAALGVVSAWQCAEQFFVSNQLTIEQYEKAPQTILEPLGVQPGSFQQFLLEHQLYSKGIRGFFTTSNSAGSFALLSSFAAIALFLEKLKSRNTGTSLSRPLITSGLAAAAVILGLAITRSKGAIAASLLAAPIFVIYLLFGNRLRPHKKVITIVCLLVLIAGSCVFVWYGLTHERLPGGNSLLVRWQYWVASVRMYGDHRLTGIGPGNFVYFYPSYKSAGAMETVTDPHNFLLSILTQYGPLGLVGFLAMIFVPLLWRTSSAGDTCSSQTPQQGLELNKLASFFFLVIPAVGLLLIRPIIMPLVAADSPEVIAYSIFVLYVTPVVAFAVGCWLLAANASTARIPSHNITAAALWCAAVGVLVHNTIDFAIFEPGVWTTFWTIVACLIALNLRQQSRPQLILTLSPSATIAAVTGGIVVIWVCINYSLIPVAKSIAKIERAQQAGSQGQFEQAHSLLDAAAKDDQLSPAALYLNGQLYLQQYRRSASKQTHLLLRSEQRLQSAINRNRIDFKNFERLSEVYSLLAEAPAQPRTEWLNRAYDSLAPAIGSYPGSSRLHFKLAKIAEQLDKTDVAINHYKKAVEIEDSHRRLFQLMYPGREIFSRLGEENYQSAKQQIKQLGEKTTP